MIRGTINEARRRFTAEDGTTGTVEFGRSNTSGTNARVTLPNGKQAFTKYSNPRDVLLRFYKGKRRDR